MKIDLKTKVSIAELAAVLGLTSRRVRQLAQDGIIVAEEKGNYNLPKAVQNYIDFRIKEKAISKAENDKLDADVSIKKAKAIITDLEAKELQGKMHRSEDVAAMTEDLVYTIRGMMLALPGRLAVDTVNAKSPAETSEIIRKEVYAIMEELSTYRYDAKKYNELVRKRLSWEDDEEGAGDDE